MSSHTPYQQPGSFPQQQGNWNQQQQQPSTSYQSWTSPVYNSTHNQPQQQQHYHQLSQAQYYPQQQQQQQQQQQTAQEGTSSSRKAAFTSRPPQQQQQHSGRSSQNGGNLAGSMISGSNWPNDASPGAPRDSYSSYSSSLAGQPQQQLTGVTGNTSPNTGGSTWGNDRLGVNSSQGISSNNSNSSGNNSNHNNSNNRSMQQSTSYHAPSSLYANQFKNLHPQSTSSSTASSASSAALPSPHVPHVFGSTQQDSATSTSQHHSARGYPSPLYGGSGSGSERRMEQTLPLQQQQQQQHTQQQGGGAGGSGGNHRQQLHQQQRDPMQQDTHGSSSRLGSDAMMVGGPMLGTSRPSSHATSANANSLAAAAGSGGFNNSRANYSHPAHGATISPGDLAIYQSQTASATGPSSMQTNASTQGDHAGMSRTAKGYAVKPTPSPVTATAGAATQSSNAPVGQTQAAKATETSLDSASAGLKRKRGRPKGSINKPRSADESSAGPKVKKSNSLASQSAIAAAQATATGAPGSVPPPVVKRGRGRPRKIIETIPKFDLPKHLLTSTGTFTGSSPTQSAAAPPNKKKRGRPSKDAATSNPTGLLNQHDNPSALEAASIQAAISQGAFVHPHFFDQLSQQQQQQSPYGLATQQQQQQQPKQKPKVVEKIVVKEVKVPVEKVVYRDRPVEKIVYRDHHRPSDFHASGAFKAKLLGKVDELRTFGNGLESEEMQSEFDELLRSTVKLIEEGS